MMTKKRRNTDSLLLLNYFTLVALALLFCFGYMVGVTGLVIVSVALSMIMYFIFCGKGLGKSYENALASTDKIEGQALLIALFYLCYSSYLSLGLYSFISFIKEGSILNLFSYFWLVSLSVPLFPHFLLISYKKNNRSFIAPKIS